MSEEKEKKPAAEPKTETPAPASAAGAEKGTPKISQMTIQEVEKALLIVKEKMGGFTSRHAQNLLLRKKALTSK